jgi:2-oxoglutarate dehydrogenase E2 component (dihydrolipoamide succinyltransferase)
VANSLPLQFKIIENIMADLIMPKLGESIMEAKILRWLKKEGDSVALDEAVLEIATDKVDSEVPSPFAGTLTKILFPEGETVEIGKAIAIIESGATSNTVTTPPVATPVEVPATTVANLTITQNTTSTPAPSNADSNRFYSPLVLNIAKEEKISMSELEAIPGTGGGGRVTKKDILSFVANRGNAPVATTPVVEATFAPAVSTPVASVSVTNEAPKSAPANTYGGNVEIIEMDRMRKLIAEHMVKSVQTSPHVTSYVEADVTNIVQWREKWKGKFKQKEGENLTFTPIFIEAIIKAIKDFPNINCSLDGDKIILKKDINIGMAAALPTGNLIVPVIKNADQLNMLGLAKKVNDLANRARSNKLTPDDITGGTYTITNVGTFGNVMGTPIINQPQVAIMAVGAIRKKPVVVETAEGDFIGIRHMMFLSHSYDHRIVDGALGGMFVRKVADYLEQFDVNRDI